LFGPFLCSCACRSGSTGQASPGSRCPWARHPSSRGEGVRSACSGVGHTHGAAVPAGDCCGGCSRLAWQGIATSAAARSSNQVGAGGGAQERLVLALAGSRAGEPGLAAAELHARTVLDELPHRRTAARRTPKRPRRRSRPARQRCPTCTQTQLPSSARFACMLAALTFDWFLQM